MSCIPAFLNRQKIYQTLVSAPQVWLASEQAQVNQSVGHLINQVSKAVAALLIGSLKVKGLVSSLVD